MAIPYTEPGVTTRETESPNYSVPASGAPTVIGIVGPSRGYREVTDVIQLVDSAPVTLSATGVDTSTVVVVDADDPNGSAFVESTPSAGALDYTLTADGDSTTIQRTMQTTIADGEEVVTYFETDSTSPAQAAGLTKFVTLDRTTSEFVDGASGSTQTADTLVGSLKVQNKGFLNTGDYTIANEGGASPTIVYENTNGVVGKYQTLYLNYTVSETRYVDQPFKLNDGSTVALPANADDILVKNAPDLGDDGSELDEVALYDAAESTTDDDYVVSGTGVTLAIARSSGSTTIGADEDQLRVRVTYRSTPTDYWTPTRITSPADAEAKYGAALDSNGNISSPLSFAAGCAFGNGAPELTLQALFAAGSPNTDPTGATSDWTSTFQAMRVAEDVNVIIPITGIGGSVTSSNDSLISGALSAAKTHAAYMKSNANVDIDIYGGSDSTLSGQGEQATRRSLAQTFADEVVNVLSPGRYQYINQLNRRIRVGGQYAAACYAGMLARYPVQQTMTRKTMLVLSAVDEVVERQEKNRDAAAGLTVLENNGGRIRVRHALTTDTSTVAKSEQNVVRAKHHKNKRIHDVIDSRIIGQITADEKAAFTSKVIISGVLESLVIEGVIVSYRGLTTRLSTSNPTQIDVRYSYKPSFSVNYVTVEYNIDLSQGTISLNELPTAGV